VKGQENLVSTLRHGKSRRNAWAPEYYSWASMVQRCTNPARINYHLYGGRGIAVCDRWLHSFDAFLADMGNRPKGTSLGRVDPDGDYCLANCEWQSYRLQNRSRRNNKLSHEAAAAIRSSRDSRRTLAARYGVSKVMIARVLRGEAWA
jgi:hypothetical protein